MSTAEAAAITAIAERPPDGPESVVGLDEFSPAPEALAAAYGRGKLRLDVCVPVEGVPDEHIMGYAECVREHEELARRADHAQERFVALIAGAWTPPKRDEYEGSPKQYSSWHLGERVLPDLANDSGLDRKVPVAYQLKVWLEGGKRLGEQGFQGVQVTAYPVHQPHTTVSGKETAFRGHMDGLVYYEADGLTRKVDGLPPILDFEALKKTVLIKLQDVARYEVLERWVDSYAQICSIPHTVGNRIGYGLRDTHLGVLLKASDNRGSLLDIMARAFKAGELRYFYMLLDIPMNELAQDLQKDGLTHRFNWLTANIVAIMSEIEDTIRHRVSFGFKDAFKIELAAEAAKVAKLNQFCEAFELETSNINDCRPGQQR